MSWRDRYRQASYAGAPFLIDSHEFSGGRVGAVHSYPQREKPFVEDTGRMPRSFSIRGFILGEDYDLARDKLVKACEARSPSYPVRVGRTLSHPYLGVLEVFCTGFSVRERVSDGRMCTVNMSFVETSETVFPVRSRSNTSATDDAAEGLNDASSNAGEEDITVDGPESVRQATSRATSELGTFLANLDVFRGTTNDVAVFADQVLQLVNNAVALAVAPATLVATIRSAIEAIFTIGGTPRTVFEAYRALFGFSTFKATGTSLNARLAAANSTAVENLALQFATSGAARAAVRVDWTFLGEALEGRQVVLDQIDVLANCSNDEVCLALPELLAATAEGVPNPNEDLPRLETLTLIEWEPSLVTGWRLYADAGSGDEIATRNVVPRAGFLPALTPLEVLVRV